jgi:plastocyanin
MDRGNRVLQAAGLAIIIISLVSVSFYFSSSAQSTANQLPLSSMMPGESRIKNDPSIETRPISAVSAVPQSSNASGSVYVVNIVDGAGEQKSVAQPFFPGSIKIHAGDVVNWINRDNVDHTVTSTLFNSGLIMPRGSAKGASIFSHKFNEPGVYTYFCQIHPYMSGTIYVDVDETQRQIVSTNHPGLSNIMIEMPRNAAYQNNYGQYFIPSNAIVPSGSRVTWVNNDYIAHTATGSDRLTFDTGPVLPSESKSFIINGTGRLAYFCEIHPWMQGSVEIISRR